MKVTVAILSRTGELTEKFLSNLKFATEIICIVDGAKSSDFHKHKGITYYFRSLNRSFANQRNYALQKSKTNWVLFVDDDEYVSGELALEIKVAVNSKENKGYYLIRKDVVFHDVLSYGETGKTRILRLARKDFGKFSRSVHEKWIVKGNLGCLSQPLYHIKDHFVSEFIGRMLEYGELDAVALNGEKKYFSLFKIFVFPVAKFIQNYFIRLGIFDGTVGLFLSYFMSIQSLTVRIYQWGKRA